MNRIQVLSSSFYNRAAPSVARGLLGKLLLCRTPEGVCGGVIVESEAYLSRNDPACHAARGRTPRNAPMFGPPGLAYVYFTYGNHFCLNAVCRPAGVAEAVLIRALRPTRGIDLMRKRRGQTDVHALCSGPGKLCQSLGIGRGLNEVDLCGGSGLRICHGETVPRRRIIVTTRIGIREGAELPLRFYVEGSEFVSRL